MLKMPPEGSDGRMEVRVQRPVFHQEELNKAFGYEKKANCSGGSASKVASAIGKACQCSPGVLKRMIPALAWLGDYDWRKDLSGDLVAGVTVAIMHVPQGMAYALLGSVPAITGIHMAFFPVLMYTLLGTSKHISVGTFAVVCLTTGSCVAELAGTGPGLGYTPEQVAAAVSLMVCIYHLLMATLRLGIVSVLLSDPLISGFSAGAAVHAFTSQLRDTLGLRLPSRRGVFNIPLTYFDVASALPEANVAAVVVSVVTVVVLCLNNEALKPWLSKRCNLPVPIELIVVVSATLIATQTGIIETYGLRTLGFIPIGLPAPTIPPLELLPQVAAQSFMIAIVAYTIVMSLSLLFGTKYGYEVDGNQELVALGFSNLVGSLFCCMPVTASPSRSSLQCAVGGNTQLTSLVSCTCLLVVLLWVGPFFSALPRCVLGAIVMVALKPMIMQVRDVVRFTRMSRFDGAIWVATFLAVVLVDMDVGLAVGVVLSLAVLFVHGVTPYTCRLEPLPGTDIYVDTKKYGNTVALRGIQIFQFCGVLNFASQSHFKASLLKLVRAANLEKGKPSPVATHTIIVDLSAVTRIDPAGVSALRSVRKDLSVQGISIILAGANPPVFEALHKCCGILDSVVFQVFPTVHDAVVCAECVSYGGNFASTDTTLAI